MADFVLEDRCESRLRDDGLFELLQEPGLASFEIVIEVDEHAMKRDTGLAWSVPVIRVRQELLPGRVAIEPKALVQADEAKLARRPESLRKVWSKAPEEIRGDARIVANHAILVSVHGVVRGEGRSGTLDEINEPGALIRRVDPVNGPQQWFRFEAHRQGYGQGTPEEIGGKLVWLTRC